MIFSIAKCISIEVAEQIVISIIVFAANFKILKNGSNSDVIMKHVTGVVINMQKATIFEPIILNALLL